MNEKEVLLPVVSHHCRTTHSACDCVLKRLKKLEAVAMTIRNRPLPQRSKGLP